MISLTTIMIAKEIDIDKSKGTDQERIVSLYPEPAKKDIAQDITIKVLFDVELDAKHIKKNDITLEKISDKKKKVKGETILSTDAKTVTFKPEVPLEVGYYEIKIKSLKPIKEEKKKKIKEIKYRFYVTEVETINGYVLPPEPDETINNSTMLGIDSNDNGVRDDVERHIVTQYKDHHKIVTEIGFQKARAYQKILDNPLNTQENHKALMDAMDCNFYFESRANFFGDPILINHVIYFKSLQLNRKSRVRAYLLYDKQLSGGVYSLTKAHKMKQHCSEDVLVLLGGE